MLPVQVFAACIFPAGKPLAWFGCLRECNSYRIRYPGQIRITASLTLPERPSLQFCQSQPLDIRIRNHLY